MSDSIYNGEYSIQRLSSSNLIDVAKLHAAVYKKDVSEIYFLKKYDTAYTGVAYIGFIAYNSEQVPISYYGVIPCLLQYGNTSILAAQSADTMTHPLYRYKGLFVALANLTITLCRDNDIRIIFGFPNQHSLHGFIQKLSWEMTGFMDCFTVPVYTFPLEKFCSKFSFLTHFYSKYKQWILKKYSLPQPGIENSAIEKDYAVVDRNDAYLRYKCYTGTEVIRIGRSLSWIRINNGFIIGDMTITPDDFDEVMRKITRLAVKLGIRQVLFHTSQDTLLHTLFKQRFKSVVSFPVLCKDLGAGIPLDKIKFTFADIDIF